jgi:hypothetical protein
MMMGAEAMAQHKQIICRSAMDGAVGNYFAFGLVETL